MTRALDLFRRLQNEGEDAIDALIDQHAPEELFLDFKQSATSGAGTSLHDIDRKNFRKAISGFGNSDGGIIVWGVDCRSNPKAGDVALGKKPLENPQRFRSWLEGVVSGCTVPPHGGVQSIAIPAKTSPGYGFVASLIEQAVNLPLQAVPDHAYFMRAGSNFARVPHGVLSGMFGRPLYPSFQHHWDVKHVKRLDNARNAMRVLAALMIRNNGPGLARDLYASIEMLTKLGNKCACAIIPGAVAEWQRGTAFGRLHTVMSQPDMRLPPGGAVIAFHVELTLPAPPVAPLSLSGVCGSGNGVPHHFTLQVAPAHLAQSRDAFFAAMPTAKAFDAKRARGFGKLIFK